MLDRLSHLIVTIPPMRECREDLRAEIEHVLQRHALPGNLRDLPRLAVLTMAWWSEVDASGGVRSALREWEHWSAPIESKGHLGEGTRAARIRRFRQQLAQWAKEQHGTWAAAAAALGCDEKTLRPDASEGEVAGQSVAHPKNPAS